MAPSPSMQPESTRSGTDRRDVPEFSLWVQPKHDIPSLQAHSPVIAMGSGLAGSEYWQLWDALGKFV